jgi:hypothetical protein
MITLLEVSQFVDWAARAGFNVEWMLYFDLDSNDQWIRINTTLDYEYSVAINIYPALQHEESETTVSAYGFSVNSYDATDDLFLPCNDPFSEFFVWLSTSEHKHAAPVIKCRKLTEINWAIMMEKSA